MTPDRLSTGRIRLPVYLSIIRFIRSCDHGAHSKRNKQSFLKISIWVGAWPMEGGGGGGGGGACIKECHLYIIKLSFASYELIDITQTMCNGLLTCRPGLRPVVVGQRCYFHRSTYRIIFILTAHIN